MKKIQKLYLTGMHCKACETIVRQVCNSVEGIQCQKISHKTGLLQFSLQEENNSKQLKSILKKKGYTRENQPLDPSWGRKKLGSKDKKQICIITLVVLCLMRVLGQFDRTQNLAVLLGGTGYLAAVGTGLVASVSTCLALTGGIVVGFSNYMDDEKTMRKHAWTHLGFHIGRVMGFFFGGAVLGLLGSVIQVSLSMTIFISIIVSLLMIYVGLQMLDIVPPLSYWGIHIPASWTDRLHTHNHPRLAPFVGALTFFIPCGFTQSMQFVALGSGGWFGGAMVMALFALGTFPALFAIGMGSSWIKDRSRGVMKQGIGVLLIAFSFSTLFTTQNLIGRGSTQNASTYVSQEPIIGDSINLTVEHNGWEIEGWNIEVPANVPYTITIIPQENGIGCMGSLVIPSLGVRQPQRIIKETPITIQGDAIPKGNYPIVCASMGMSMGAIIAQ